jgi:hypothetical protein
MIRAVATGASMSRNHPLLPLLVLVSLVLLTGCDTSPLFPTCQSDDLDCYVTNLGIDEVDPDAKTQVHAELTNVPLSAILALAAPAADSADFATWVAQHGQPPQIKSVTRVQGNGTLDQFNPDYYQVGWTDPTGSRPLLCMCVCSPGMRCAMYCPCVGQLRDGQQAGNSTFGHRYKAEPAQDSQQVSVQAYPIVGVNGQPGPAILSWVQNGSPPANPPAGVVVGPAGPPLAQTVVKPKQSTQPSGTNCSSYGNNKCGGSSFAFYDGGLCHCCMKFNSQCLKCSGSCDANSHCFNGVCIFNQGGNP